MKQNVNYALNGFKFAIVSTFDFIKYLSREKFMFPLDFVKNVVIVWFVLSQVIDNHKAPKQNTL